MTVTGAYHCGQITYEAEVDPERSGICHCTDCQILTGSAFRVSIPTVAGTFRLLNRYSERLPQDHRGQWCKASARLLSGLRLAGVFHSRRRESVHPNSSCGRSRAAGATCTQTPNLVQVRPLVVPERRFLTGHSQAVGQTAWPSAPPCPSLERTSADAKAPSVSSAMFPISAVAPSAATWPSAFEQQGECRLLGRVLVPVNGRYAAVQIGARVRPV